MTPGPGPGPVTLPGQPAVVPMPSLSTEENHLNYMMSPRNSISITHTKGLLNMPGQNNCFLNSAVQVLWHLDVFRWSFRELSGHACMAESCIFCALKELFAQFQYSQESALPPDALRRALAKTFSDQRRFQLGFMDDAAECFENILLRIHFHIANQESEDMCSAAHCIPHQKFAMTLVEQTVCHACGATSEPLPFTQLAHYVSTSALCSQAVLMREQRDESPASQFGELLRKAGGMGDIRDCPSTCGAKINIRRSLMNRPEIVSVGLVWDSECPTLDHIMEVFQLIGTTLKLKDVFHSVVDNRWASTAMHQLVGVVTYYGKHYSTFFFHTKLRVWIYFDDATVREIGPSWQQVIEKCRRGHFQPLLLLYSNPQGTPVVTTTAPRTITMVNAQNRNSEPTINLSKEGIQRSTQAQELNQRSVMASPTRLSRITNSSDNPCNLQPPNGDIKHHGFQHNHGHHPHQISLLKNHSPNSYIPYLQCSPKTALPTTNFHSTHNGQHPQVCDINHQSRQPCTDQTHRSSPHPYENHHLLNNNLPYPSPGEDSYLSHETSVIRDSLNQDGALNNNHISKDPDAISIREQELNNTYISRKTVENVLNLQKLQRQRVQRSLNYTTNAGNRNSSSSLDSFDNTVHNKGNYVGQPLKLTIPDAENLPRRRDSGNWSGDRNSASSSSSTSLDNPYLVVLGNKRLMSNMNYRNTVANGKGNFPDYINVNVSDQGYDSFSLSSTDSYPSVTGSPVKLDPRLTQIPENIQTSPATEEDLKRKLDLITQTSKGPPDCDTLCAEADLLLSKSHDKEKEGDIVMAALLSDSAAARARAAMDAPYSNSHSLASAKMKHSTCVMRSSCLYRKLKEAEAEEKRRQKGALEGHHSRQSSRDSTHSRHSRQGSKDASHVRQGSKDSSHQPLPEGLDISSKSIEIYGTLPKKGNKRKVISGTSSVKARDENEIYKDFLDRQRQSTKTCNNVAEQKVTSTKNHSKTEGQSTVRSKSVADIEKHQKKPPLPNGSIGKANTLKRQELEVSDYSSEWEQGKQSVLCRTYSGSSMKSMEYGDFFQSDSTEQCTANRKQHKIKRKLMGSFMKRKNRSLPDLREGQDLTDHVNHAYDDSSLRQLPSSPIPIGKLKAKENLTDAKLLHVSRGFHQPHRAFINRDSYQRPLLMKVTPPHVQAAASSPPKNKPLNTKDSTERSRKIPQPINHHLTAEEITVPSCQVQTSTRLSPLPSNIPFPLSVNTNSSNISKPSLSPLMCHGIQLTHPQNSEKRKDINTTGRIPEPVGITVTSISDDLPPASNGFLAEIQAKRQQILVTSPKRKTTLERTSSTHCYESRSLLKSPNSMAKGSASWLQELQTKQLQILQKKSQHTPSAGEPVQDSKKDESVVKIEKHPIVEVSPNYVQQGIKESNKFQLPAVKIPIPSTATTTVINGHAEQQGRNDGQPDNKIIHSVRDLASRFEHMFTGKNSENGSQELNPHSNFNQDESNSSTFSIEEANRNTLPKAEAPSQCDDAKDRLKTIELSQCRVSPIPTLLPITNKQEQCVLTVSIETPQVISDLRSPTNLCLPEITPKCHKDSNSSDIGRTSEMSVLQKQRPDKPPDYETAIQRIGLIRTSQVASSDNHHKNSAIPGPQVPSSSCSSLVEPSKKKRGPKKCVTFSDKVVLVACADDEEDDYVPNPLLEKVYRQHLLQNGACETAPLNCPPDSVPAVTPEKPISKEQIGDNCCKPAHVEQSNNGSPCHLCHNKIVNLPDVYCSDCAFYMARFQPQQQ